MYIYVTYRCIRNLQLAWLAGLPGNELVEDCALHGEPLGSGGRVFAAAGAPGVGGGGGGFVPVALSFS